METESPVLTDVAVLLRNGQGRLHAAVLQLEDVIEDDTGEVVGGDGGLVDAALDIVHDRRPLGGAASVSAIKSR